jgi:ubiquinone/menaquinone biosynthesis C-methylase UbiE
MKAEANRFLEQLKPVEHQYLFSRKSIGKFFKGLGTSHIKFERAIFYYYDIFLFASRLPLKAYSSKKVQKSLMVKPKSRLILALLDCDDRYRLLTKQHEYLASDNESRLEVIEEQGMKIVTLEKEVDRWLEQSKALQEDRNTLEAERNRLQFELKDIRNQFEIVEVDRAARLEVIEEQGRKIVALEKEVDRWIIQNKALQESRVFNFLKLIGLFRTPLDQKNFIQTQQKNESQRYSMGKPIDIFRKEIDRFNASQSNRDLLDGIRNFNHQMIDDFNSCFSLNGALILDIGASPHGYALERALEHDSTLYVGIGLDINKPEYIFGEKTNVGILINMDATSIKFPDEIFDAVISASTFEHIASVSSVLTEIHRVLKPGGCAFITSEPVWSYSRGHHLHHFGECSELIPPWAHLEWTPEQLREFLSDKWPSDASISLEKAIDWIYYGDELNRLNIQEYRNLFEKCPLKIEWIAHLKDNKERYKPSTLKRISDITGLSSDDLTAKGFSALLVKEL